MLLNLLLFSVALPYTHVRCTESVSGRHSATFVAAVACSLHAGGDRFFHHPPAVFGQAQEAHQVYEGGGEIELAAKLAGGVVKGECVVVVVKAFP